MADEQGLVSFGNIQCVSGGSMTIVAGISPSVATIEFAPQQEPLQEHGELRFSFGAMQKTFIECKADFASAQRNDAGTRCLVSIFDRRWKWRFGNIGGEYNIRKPNGEIKTGTEKTPQELARLCCEAMGEDSCDVGAMPDDARPYVKWDVIPPAEALADLCDKVGCRVVARLDRRHTVIVKAGEGANLPENWLMSFEKTWDQPEVPDEIGIVCAPTRYQHDFELEAIGRDTDKAETIRPIDELSYKPANGWSCISPVHFMELHGKDREAALDTVWRLYRIKMPPDGLVIAGYDEPIKYRDQIAIDATRCEVASEDDAETTKYKPAIVYGRWSHTGKTGIVTDVTQTIDPDNPGDSKLPITFSVDTGKGYVLFSKPVYRNTSEVGLNIQPPDIRLRCACNIKANDTWAMLRKVYTQPTGRSNSAGTKYVEHSEIVVNITPEKPDGVNADEVSRQCRYYADAFLAELKEKVPIQAVYFGLIDAELDGAIQQITYSISDGATTTLTWNTEDIVRIPSYKERRMMERRHRADQLANDAEQAATDFFDLRQVWP